MDEMRCIRRGRGICRGGPGGEERNMNDMTFIATGDSFITRRIPEGGYEGQHLLREIIGRHDVRFTNLEMTFHHMEGTPAAESGGTWAMADPRCLDDMRGYGFNLYTTANNHSGDYGEGGVLATIRHLQERDMIFSGTGRNLAEASRPCYLETRKGRVALVSASSSFSAASAAGPQSGEAPGRPGLNPLRVQTTYHVTRPYFDMVRELAAATGINAMEDYAIRLGYLLPKQENVQALGQYRFVLDEENRVVSEPREKDMQRIETEIREAGRQADVVLVSIHAHEADYGDFSVPAGFLETFARRCVDAGAAVVIGHGPHELRGIECYHGGLIFYSLGNFIFQTETVSLQPGDAFAGKGLPPDTKVGEYMDQRSKNGTIGYPSMENIWRSVMAAWTMRDGKLSQVQLYPLSLRMGQKRTIRGTPVLAESDAVLRYLAELSRPYGTEIVIRDGIGYIDF